MITFYPCLARLYTGHSRNRKKSGHSDAPKASLLKVSYSNYAVLLLASFRLVSLNITFIFKDTPVFSKLLVCDLLLRTVVCSFFPLRFSLKAMHGSLLFLMAG